jgi:hypothetical protein
MLFLTMHDETQRTCSLQVHLFGIMSKFLMESLFCTNELKTPSCLVGFIRRLFSRVTDVESAEILESKGEGSHAFCISRVVFNTLKDPVAPARAVAMFHRVKINGFQLGCLYFKTH